jgi:hypothetical protein
MPVSVFTGKKRAKFIIKKRSAKRSAVWEGAPPKRQSKDFNSLNSDDYKSDESRRESSEFQRLFEPIQTANRLS